MSVWEITPQRERINFGQCEIIVEEMEAKNNSKYNKITINIFPVVGSRNDKLQTGVYFKFSEHTRPWDSDVLPAIRELVLAGKIQNAPAINDRWVSWKWGQYRTYREKDIGYWEQRANDEENQGKIEDAAKSRAQIKNENGRQFIEKGYIHILDVFANEAACQAAHDEHYGVDSSKADEIPGFEDEEKEKPEVNKDHQTAAVGLVMGLDLGDGFESFFNSNEIMTKVFVTIENEIVKKAKEKFGRVDNDELKRWILEELALPF